MVHITNYSIQKYSDKFGIFEDGNEASFHDFQYYLNGVYGNKKIDVKNTIWKRILEIIKITCKAVSYLL